MGGSSFGASADLDGVFGADEDVGGMKNRTMLREVFSDEFGVIKAAAADVLGDGRQRNYLD